MVERGFQVYAINPKQLDRFRDRYSMSGAKDDRLRPLLSRAPRRIRWNQETTQPEPQGAQEYMDANEQVSVFGIEMRLDARKAERDIQGLLVIDIEPVVPAPPRDCIRFASARAMC